MHNIESPNLWEWLEAKIDEAEENHIGVTKEFRGPDYQRSYLAMFRAKVILGKESVLLTDPKTLLAEEYRQYTMPALGNTVPAKPPMHQTEHIADMLGYFIEELQQMEAQCVW